METVSRRAYFGGFAIGIAVAVGGYYLIPALGLDGGAAAVVELGAVALAMGAAFAIWRASARAGLSERGASARAGVDDGRASARAGLSEGRELDTSTGAEQRKEGDEPNRSDPRGV